MTEVLRPWSRQVAWNLAMLTAIAEHSVTLMAMVRAMVADPQAPAESDSDGEPDGGLGNASADTAENGSRYQPIPIVVETITVDD